jgi:hypothetical protein
MVAKKGFTKRKLARVFGEHSSSSRKMNLNDHDTYSDYLKSPEWLAIRNSVLDKRPKCELCGCNAEQVHHDSYDGLVMSGAVTDALVSLCRKCHEAIEFDGKRKLGMFDVRGKLRRMLQEAGNRATFLRINRAKRLIKRSHKSAPVDVKKKPRKGRSAAPVIVKTTRRKPVRQNAIPGIPIHVDWSL